MMHGERRNKTIMWRNMSQLNTRNVCLVRDIISPCVGMWAGQATPSRPAGRRNLKSPDWCHTENTVRAVVTTCWVCWPNMLQPSHKNVTHDIFVKVKLERIGTPVPKTQAAWPNHATWSVFFHAVPSTKSTMCPWNCPAQKYTCPFFSTRTIKKNARHV